MRIAVSAAALLLGSAAIAGGPVWDEGVDGDLSTDPLAPTPIAFGLGSNIVIGEMQSPSDTRDYLTFVIPAGQALSELNLLGYEDLDVGGPGDTGFNAIHPGATSQVPSGANSGDFLGGNHVLDSFVGTDLLPGLAAGALSGTGFASPLGPGTYTYLIQQTGPERTGYELEFVFIPSPAGSVAMLTGMGVIAIRRRRA